MKTKDLITKLQEADPSGEIECCVGNADIFFVERTSAFWDGRLQILERDHSKDPYYNICGAKRTAKGSKIQIHTLSISDALLDNPDLPIDYSELGSQQSIDEYKQADDTIRQRIKNMDEDIECKLFIEWAWKEANKLVPDDSFKEDLKEIAENFYRKNLKYTDKFLPVVTFVNTSHNTRRYDQWSFQYRLKWELDYWIIESKK